MYKHLMLIIALLSLTNGCASMAKRPPSPATELTPEELLATPVPANERYYLLVFGSQSKPIRPTYTHSWATVVKVTNAPNGATPQIEQHTISWMPASLDILPWRFRVEPGTNLDLHVTLDEVLRHKEHVSMWGPYEIWHGMYRRFVTQKAFIESGAIGYQCIDTIGEAARCGNGSDCIHAVTDMDPQFDRGRYSLRYFGESASENMVKQIQERPVLIRPQQTHDWLIPLLGLDRYPICRRTYGGASKEFSPEALRESLGNRESGRCAPR